MSARQRRLCVAAPVLAAALTCTLGYPVHLLAILGVPRGRFEDAVRREVRRQLTAQVITVDQ